MKKTINSKLKGHYFSLRIFFLFLLLFLSKPLPIAAFDAHPLFFEGLRMQGMGGTSVAVCGDEQVLYSNPAALSQRDKKGYSILNISGEANRDFRRVKNETNSLSEEDTPEGRAFNNRVLSGIMGQKARLQAANLAYYLGSEGFGIGYLYKVLAEIEVRRPTNPRVKNLQVIDSVLSGSFAKPVFGDHSILSDKANGWWGGTIKMVTRSYINREYDPRDFAILSENELTSNRFNGTMADFDFGTYWTLNNAWWQTLGLTVTNVFANEIDPKVGNLRRWVAIGTTIHPNTGSIDRQKKLMLAADLVNLAERGTFANKLRLGLEAFPRPWLALRGGIRGGYLSTGFSATFRSAKLDFATYSEEIGPRPGDLEDRRYSLSISITF